MLTDTSPPRCDLIPSACLLDCGLVPSAIIYYSGTSDIKLEIKHNLTDPKEASLQAAKLRYLSFIFYFQMFTSKQIFFNLKGRIDTKRFKNEKRC